LANSVVRKYEGMFLVDSASATSDWDGVIESIKTIMARAGAEIDSLNKWDDRRLCYEIKGHNRGTYLLCYFDAPPGSISGIERDVQISEVLLRVLILNAEQIPEEITTALTPAMAAKKREQEAAERKAKEQADRAAKKEEAAERADEQTEDETETESQEAEVGSEVVSVEDILDPPEKEIVVDAIETDENGLGSAEPVDSESGIDDSDA